jgi:hypothetical protein
MILLLSWSEAELLFPNCSPCWDALPDLDRTKEFRLDSRSRKLLWAIENRPIGHIREHWYWWHEGGPWRKL